MDIFSLPERYYWYLFMMHRCFDIKWNMLIQLIVFLQFTEILVKFSYFMMYIKNEFEGGKFTHF